MHNLEPGLALVAAALIVIVIIQNTQPVETRILLFSITMPRVVLLFVATLIGFLPGMVWSVRNLNADKRVGE